MGGYCFIIDGTFSEDKLKPQPVKKNLIDKLLHRQRFTSIKKTALGKENVLYELPLNNLKNFPKDFLSFIKTNIPEPSEATSIFIDYLSIDIFSIYIRGEGEENSSDINWYIQCSFSGCAGMAQTCSELASHWVELWYLKNSAELYAKYFAPIHFSPQSIRPEDPPFCFIPVETLGYARLINDLEADNEDQTGSRYLQFDESTIEAMDDKELEHLSKLDPFIEDKFLHSTCHCQLCDPQFKALQLPG